MVTERGVRIGGVKAPQKGNHLAEGGDKEGRHGTTGNVA